MINKKYPIYKIVWEDDYSTLRHPFDELLVSDESPEKAKSRLEERMKDFHPHIFKIEQTKFYATEKGIIE